MTLKFKELFKPVEIGKVAVKNRLAMAPMGNESEESYSHVLQSITRRCIDYYVERAKGGIGLIITGVFKVENGIDQDPGWPVVLPSGLNALGELADYVHAYGTKLFIQLTAGSGRNLFPSHLSGVRPVSASDNPSFWNPTVICRTLTTDEVEEIVEAFKTAAELIASIGIDGVEVHGHEGYLIDQFVTSLWNRRGDKYGGDLKRRLTFPIEILNAVKEGAGRDLPVTYRMGVKHFIRGLGKPGLRPGSFEEKGRDVEESRKIVQILEKVGYDGFHLDTGCYESMYYSHPPMYCKHGFHLPLIKGFRQLVNVPIITANRLDVPRLALKAVVDGYTDMVAIGRGLLADPYWPNKVKRGDIEDIRPCIGCDVACLERLAFRNRPISCSVNPSCGRERRSEIRPAHKQCKILIVGGGVAGMEAARVLAIRGHVVLLYEKSGNLGGHLIAASAPDFKKDIERLLNWYIYQLKKLKIKVFLNSEVTPEIVKKIDPDAVVLATGSTPLVPQLPGINKTMVVTCEDLLTGKKKAGNICVVIGGEQNGSETALWLAQQGKNVMLTVKYETLLKKRPMNKSNRDMLLDLLEESNVSLMTNTVLEEVTDEGVVVRSKTGSKAIPCDTVVLALGYKKENALYQSLKYEIPELYEIGDCKEPREIHDAIWEGFNIGNLL